MGMIVRSVHMSHAPAEAPGDGAFVAALVRDNVLELQRCSIYIGRFFNGEFEWDEDDSYDSLEELDRWFAARITGVLTEKVSSHGFRVTVVPESDRG
jgi:hypothetical protein